MGIQPQVVMVCDGGSGTGSSFVRDYGYAGENAFAIGVNVDKLDALITDLRNKVDKITECYQKIFGMIIGMEKTLGEVKCMMPLKQKVLHMLKRSLITML